MDDHRKVLAYVDQSRFADYVVDYAAWVAVRLAAPLKILHVIDRHPEIASTRDRSGAIGIGAQEHLLTELTAQDESRSRAWREQGRMFLNGLRRRAAAAKRLDWARRALESAGFEAPTQLIPGDPEGVIARAIREQGIDVLAMGAYGHSPIRSLLLGSKTSDLLRSATIPTLLLR